MVTKHEINLGIYLNYAQAILFGDMGFDFVNLSILSGLIFHRQENNATWSEVDRWWCKHLG